ncbi:MAG: cobaltochelatase subunit CobN, partial [Promethearchaeota archaeon]
LFDEIVQFWGEPPGKILIENFSIMLPIIRLNNIYLCLQPSRSMVTGDPTEYHDKNLPPHHQYLAFYRYLERIADVDAIIHLGTHGTEEFLPGKECAGGLWDYPINLLGDIPNIYYYHVTNTSEAAIAKRRANALIINHAGPTFKHSGLYEELEQLDQLIRQYMAEFEFSLNKSDKDVKSERLSDLEKEIDDLAKKLELEYNSISELEDLLYRYKTSVIPMGLHILGKKYTPEEIYDFIITILLHSAEKPYEIENMFVKFGENEDKQINSLNNPLKDLIKFILKYSYFDDSLLNLCLKENFFGDVLTQEEQKILIRWIGNLIININNSFELSNLIHALEGGYIEPGLGGDPIRSPQVFPTGRNSYGFDPRLIPNTTAYRRGGEIADKLIQKYYEENGTYPETVSVVLWAFETMKTGGETIGQIFNYLGVRAVKNKSIWTTEFEVIPLEEMTHPRINVLVTICGIFRDTFPYLLELINNVIETVAALDEPLDKNFVRKSYIELQKKGIENPTARVFGPPPGKYNTNLTDIISAGKWGSEDELADDYMNNMCYAYMKNRNIKRIPDTFSNIIENIDIMSQIRDSNEYNIVDLDHYYEFTGGLAKTFEKLSGKKANVYIADTSEKNIDVDKLSKHIKEGAITRTLNPKWIKSMLNHKYHGAQKVAERVENILGLAATTHDVDNWIWDKSYKQYIENDEIRNALIENNRFAMMDIIKNMLQAKNRGYWDATEEQIENLKKLYLELENWIETKYL